MATVLVPTPLRRLTGGQRKVSVEASTINEVIKQLEERYPGVKTRLLGKEGEPPLVVTKKVLLQDLDNTFL